MLFSSTLTGCVFLVKVYFACININTTKFISGYFYTMFFARSFLVQIRKYLQHILCVIMMCQIAAWFPVMDRTDFYSSTNNLQDTQLGLEACA